MSLWDLRQAGASPAIRSFWGQPDPVDFSRDGTLVATLDADKKSIRVWDLTAVDPGLCPRVLRGHSEPVVAIAFKHDDTTVASSSEDGLRLWDLTAADPNTSTRVLPEHGGRAIQLTFSRDGRTLAAASSDKRVRIWNLDEKTIFLKVQRKIGRNLSLEEWEQYFYGEPYRPTFPSLPGPRFEERFRTFARNLSHKEWAERFPEVPYGRTFPDLPVPGEITTPTDR